MTKNQLKLINKYNLKYETTINNIDYYTDQKKDGYYFVSSIDECGIFDNKEKFYQYANMVEPIFINAIKL